VGVIDTANHTVIL